MYSSFLTYVYGHCWQTDLTHFVQIGTSLTQGHANHLCRGSRHSAVLQVLFYLVSLPYAPTPFLLGKFSDTEASQGYGYSATTEHTEEEKRRQADHPIQETVLDVLSQPHFSLNPTPAPVASGPKDVEAVF